jgi:hypothetical protein
VGTRAGGDGVTPHAHRRYLSPPEPPREPLALTLIAFAGVVAFIFGVILLWAAAA